MFGFLIFQFKKAPTLLCLSKDKTKGQSGKNATLTPIKTLPKKQDHSPVNFQIDLFTYKYDHSLVMSLNGPILQQEKKKKNMCFNTTI